MRPKYVLLTCEHATNRVPREYRGVFRGAGRLLTSHHGWDRGALGVARALEKSLGYPPHAGGHSRLLFDLNRSRECGEIFSKFTKDLSDRERERILRVYHDPHWRRLRAGPPRPPTQNGDRTSLRSVATDGIRFLQGPPKETASSHGDSDSLQFLLQGNRRRRRAFDARGVRRISELLREALGESLPRGKRKGRLSGTALST